MSNISQSMLPLLLISQQPLSVPILLQLLPPILNHLVLPNTSNSDTNQDNSSSPLCTSASKRKSQALEEKSELADKLKECSEIMHKPYSKDLSLVAS